MFQSQIDESFVAHQYIIAAQAQTAWTCHTIRGAAAAVTSDVVSTITIQRTMGPTQSPCFDYQTLGDELTSAHLSWNFYTS